MELYFRNGDHELEFISEIDNMEESWKIVNADLKKRYPGFVSYYQRFWINPDGDMWIDYGSHSEFYILKREKKGEEA